MQVQVFGTGFEGEQTAAEAFWYVEAQTITFSGEADDGDAAADGCICAEHGGAVGVLVAASVLSEVDSR
jgi:hypothetical protein